MPLLYPLLWLNLQSSDNALLQSGHKYKTVVIHAAYDDFTSVAAYKMI